LAETRLLVREALAALPPAGRETAELFYLDEYNCAEVAELLHVPKGTVKRRLHDARSRLRDLLLGQIDDAE
jgi:RNA polymerase sigma-70 factor (ECF subfamily)